MAAAVETVILQAVAADLESDLADVARRLTGERLHRGAGNVTVRIWDRPGSFTCEVADNTMITNPLIG